MVWDCKFASGGPVSTKVGVGGGGTLVGPCGGSLGVGGERVNPTKQGGWGGEFGPDG